jgi:squalene-hopene/tetraprenyl-beta-curcumene cyclase
MALDARAPTDSAIAAAASYLSDTQSPDRLWRDFETLAGNSCDWVSGFVAFALGSVGLLRDVVRDTTHALLRVQRPSGGWAYNEKVPPDADSTAWVVLALATTTVWKPSMVLRALNYLLRHKSNHGFSTYTREDGIERFIGATPDQTQGWRDTHLCVTAVVTHALLAHGLAGDARVGAAIAALRNAQREDGLWTSYWWPGSAYATAQSLRALAAAGAITDDVWRRAADGLITQQRPDGGFADDGAESRAFATAMSLTALLTRPDRRCDPAVDAAAAWLLYAQRAGHWPSAPILRIPRPMVTNPETEVFKPDELGTGVLVRDQCGIFTTAAAVAALCDYRSARLARC